MSVAVIADKVNPLLQEPPEVVNPLTLIDLVPLYACAVESPDILKVWLPKDRKFHSVGCPTFSLFINDVVIDGVVELAGTVTNVTST